MQQVLLCGAMVLSLVQPVRAAASDSPADGPPPIVLIGGRVLAENGESWLEGRTIVIEQGRIAAIREGRGEIPGSATTIDATGFYIIPGLIDLHTHLLLHPYNEAKWDDQVLRESLESRTIRGTVSAGATLEAGFTTVRELGTEGAGWADVALRDATNAGTIPGPRILAATRAIVATGCYGPSGFDPRAESSLPKGAQEADGNDAVRKAVREQIAAGADWIKLYTDYRRAPGALATPTFSLEEIRSAVDEATSAGRPVAAHATTEEGIRRAVEAGVRTIEHGYGATRETFQLMKDKGVVLCPTMAAAEAVALYAGWRPQPGSDEPPAGVALSRESLKRAMDVGVIIACGSDAGVFPHGTNAHELELMVKAGMTPARALHAATDVAAGVLKKTGELGVVRPGAAADLVILRGDPLADIGALKAPVAVIARGRIVVDKR